MRKSVFVFGSNAAGIHGAGAAELAYKKYGARWGFSYGHYGESFAIPTKDDRVQTQPLPQIQRYVDGFIAYALDHRKLTFRVTQIGCGLAGYSAKDIAPMFMGAPTNCEFDEAWRKHLGNGYTYWGTHP